LVYVLLHEWFSIFYVYFTKYALCVVLNYECFMHFGLFDVAKGGEKNGYVKKSRCYIFQDLKLSINSKRKGEKGMSKR